MILTVEVKVPDGEYCTSDNGVSVCKFLGYQGIKCILFDNFLGRSDLSDNERETDDDTLKCKQCLSYIKGKGMTKEEKLKSHLDFQEKCHHIIGLKKCKQKFGLSGRLLVYKGNELCEIAYESDGRDCLERVFLYCLNCGKELVW